MKISNVIQHLESFAALEYQEEYDNSGLITGSPELECTGVLISLDCTEDLIREAVDKNCNLIVSHHPLIFHPIRRITQENMTGRSIIAAIRADITIYAIHTNLDNIIDGVNARIADKLGLVNRKVLFPKTNGSSVGSGLIGDLENPITEENLLKHLKQTFNSLVIKHSLKRGKAVSRVALCGGAGSFLISNALRAKADFFITADVRYHEFFGAEGKMVIADIGHYESEQFTIDLLHEVIVRKFPNFAVLKSGIITNPINYYI
jgi:dinuclear metal center YbgI/SA1388 family protein